MLVSEVADPTVIPTERAPTQSGQVTGGILRTVLPKNHRGILKKIPRRSTASAHQTLRNDNYLSTGVLE